MQLLCHSLQTDERDTRLFASILNTTRKERTYCLTQKPGTFKKRARPNIIS